MTPIYGIKTEIIQQRNIAKVISKDNVTALIYFWDNEELVAEMDYLNILSVLGNMQMIVNANRYNVETNQAIWARHLI